MEIVFSSKKKTNLGDVGKGVLVSIDGAICIVVNPDSINTQTELFITDDFDFFRLRKAAVVDLKTGNVYLLPEDSECDVITNYNFEINNL